MAPRTFYWSTAICKLGWYFQAKISITWQIVYLTARGFIEMDRRSMDSKRTDEETIGQYIRPYSRSQSLFSVFLLLSFNPSTEGQNNEESRSKCWATGSSVRLFARTTHSFAHSALLALFACSAVLTCLLACSLHLLPCLWDSEWLDGYSFCVFLYFGP